MVKLMKLELLSGMWVMAMSAQVVFSMEQEKSGFAKGYHGIGERQSVQLMMTPKDQSCDLDRAETKNRFSSLPAELKLHILDHLDQRSLMEMSLVNHDFNELAKDENFWKKQCHKENVQKKNNETWYQSYANFKFEERPQYLRELYKALNHESVRIASTTAYVVPELLDVIKGGASIHDIYQRVSILKLINEPDCAEGTVRNLFFGRYKVSDIALWKELGKKNYDLNNMTKEEMISIAYKQKLPVLLRKNGTYKPITHNSKNRGVLRDMDAHRIYENAVRTFIRKYEEEFNITPSAISQ